MRAYLVTVILLSLGCADGPLEGDAAIDASSSDASSSDTIEDPPGPDFGIDAPVFEGFRDEAPLPHPLQEITAVVHGETIVVAGGIDERIAVVDEVWSFDGTTWTALPDLPAPRHHAMLVSLGGTLYLLGGMQSLRFEPLDTVFALPAGATAWEVRPALPHPLAAAVGAVVDAEVVLVGGQTDRGLASTGLLGDPETGIYRDGAAITEPREHVAGFAREGAVWVTGGRDFSPATSVASVAVYDADGDAWTSSDSLEAVRGGHSATYLGAASDRVLVAGGEIQDAALDSFEILDASTGAVVATGTLPTRRHGHAAALLGGRVYLIGGADGPIFAAIAGVESWAP
jgi:hypothetical protein